MKRMEFTDLTPPDLLRAIADEEIAADEVERVRDLEAYARELVIALRRQDLLDPHHLGVEGCSAATALERMLGEGWVMSAAVGAACRLAEETFAGCTTLDLPTTEGES